MKQNRRDATQSLIGLARVEHALKEFDRARAALRDAQDDFISAINQPEISQRVRDEYWRFWRAGGCSARQWKNWLADQMPRDRVPVRGGLRLVVKNKIVRRRIQQHGPSAA